MSLKLIITCVLLAFAVALAIVIGNRISSDALTLLLGLACGIGISLPMAAVLLYSSYRARQARDIHPNSGQNYPPIVVISPEVSSSRPWPPFYPEPHHLEREFRLVGSEENATTRI